MKFEFLNTVIAHANVKLSEMYIFLLMKQMTGIVKYLIYKDTQDF